VEEFAAYLDAAEEGAISDDDAELAAGGILKNIPNQKRYIEIAKTVIPFRRWL